MDKLHEDLDESETIENQVVKVELVFKNSDHEKEVFIQQKTETKDLNDEPLSSTVLPDMTKFGIYKNLIVLSLSFVLLFSSLGSFSNIQSTVNIEDGLGTTGLAVLYAVMVFTSLFVTLITLPLLSYKTMMLFAMMTYISYVATGFYSSWYTVVPGSVIVGFGKFKID